MNQGWSSMMILRIFASSFDECLFDMIGVGYDTGRLNRFCEFCVCWQKAFRVYQWAECACTAASALLTWRA